MKSKATTPNHPHTSLCNLQCELAVARPESWLLPVKRTSPGLTSRSLPNTRLGSPPVVRKQLSPLTPRPRGQAIRSPALKRHCSRGAEKHPRPPWGVGTERRKTSVLLLLAAPNSCKYFFPGSVRLRPRLFFVAGRFSLTTPLAEFVLAVVWENREFSLFLTPCPCVSVLCRGWISWHSIWRRRFKEAVT